MNMKKELVRLIIVWGIYLLAWSVINIVLNKFVYTHISNLEIRITVNLLVSLVAAIPPIKCLILDSFKRK